MVRSICLKSRKDVFNKVGLFDVSLAVYEDLDMWIRIAKSGLEWGHIREPLVIYYRRSAGGSLFTESLARNQDCRLRVMHRYRKEAIKRYPEMKRVFAEQLWNFGRAYALEHKSYRKAAACFFQSAIAEPNIARMIGSAISFLKSGS